MNSRARFFASLGERIGEFDSNLALDTLAVYERLHPFWRGISRLRKELKRKNLHLFARDAFFEQGKELHLNNLDNNKKKSEAVSTATFKVIESSLIEWEEYVKAFRDEIETLFPSRRYKHSFRIKDYKSLSQNTRQIKHSRQKSILDIVGLRVVPKRTELFPSLLLRFEEEYAKRIGFKLNTIAYTEKEIMNKIGKYSIYYRAVHYYIPIGNLYIEVQLRTPRIDQWSILHHCTFYKPKMSVTKEEGRYIMEFGEISNTVDYFELLNEKISD